MSTMRKSRYVTLLLAGAAATALAGCDQNDAGGAQDATLYGDPAACSKDLDPTECTTGYEAAKEEHLKQAPKFMSQAECEAAGFQQCEAAEVKTANGGSSSIFMPMMMGYLMGRTLGGMGMGGGMAPPPGSRQPGAATPPATARPVYSDRNGYLYANGNPVARVAPGTTSLGSSGTALRTTSRGGFGASAGRFGGGS
jgi:uncharacterized protein YgiB involved in biofilm formation